MEHTPMRTSRLQRSIGALALSTVTLGILASCGPSPANQTVPSDQSPSTATATATPEVGDKAEDIPADPAPDEVLDSEKFAEIEVENPEEALANDSSLIQDETIFNYTPEDIKIPSDVQEAFPSTYQTLPRYTLSYLLYSATMMDLHDSETPEETQRLAYKSLEEFLSGSIQDELQTDLDTYFADDATQDSTYESAKGLWAIAPLDMKYGHQWEHPVVGTKADVDHSRAWRGAIDSFEVRGVAQGESGVDGVLVWFNRGTEIPVSNADKDMVVYQGFGIVMIPSGEDGWVMDGYTFDTHSIQEIEVP